jgi:hypothetical protein
MAEQITEINLDLSQINAQTATNLFLYGTIGTPANKQRATQNTIQVNVFYAS